jgi:hypothetical protein
MTGTRGRRPSSTIRQSRAVRNVRTISTKPVKRAVGVMAAKPAVGAGRGSSTLQAQQVVWVVTEARGVQQCHRAIVTESALVD